MMNKMFMALLFWPIHINAKIPEWATHNSTKLNGQILMATCHGTGPSLDIARSEALKSCQSNASQFFRSKIKIKSMSIETEKSVGFHQEISNSDEIEGLTCDPQRDQIDESESQYSVWLECKFNLDKVSGKSMVEKEAMPDNSKLNTLERSEFKVSKDIQNKYVFISTVPRCESILVRGSRPRSILCSQNPLKIEIDANDAEILVRAKGYKPKTINVKGVNTNETIQVLLDLL